MLVSLVITVFVAYNTVCACSCMPPPKRPKSDVRWTALCDEGEVLGNDSHNCANVNNTRTDGDIIATSTLLFTEPQVIVPADVCVESPLDLRRQLTSDVTNDDVIRDDVTGGDDMRQHSTWSTSLRRLLLEPLAPASNSRRPSVLASAPSTDVMLAQSRRQCKSNGASCVVFGTQRGLSMPQPPGSQNHCRTEPDAITTAAAASSPAAVSHLPAAPRLRRILLADDNNDDDDDDVDVSERRSDGPAAASSQHQQSNAADTGDGSLRSSRSSTQPVVASSSNDHPQTASSSLLSTSSEQVPESRDSASTNQRRVASVSLTLVHPSCSSTVVV